MTTGEEFLQKVYGDSRLSVIQDSRSEITFTQDLNFGNCSSILQSDWIKQFPNDGELHGAIQIMDDPIKEMGRHQLRLI